MSRMKVIIISGPTCSGKTTLAKMLAKRARLPIVNIVPIREFLFNKFGYTNLLMCKENRKASFSIIFIIIRLLLKCSLPLIIDLTFGLSENRKKIVKLQKKYKFKCLQINLKAIGGILWGRYQTRIRSGQQHPGYLYNLRLNQKRKNAIQRGFTVPPKIQGKTLIVDTTDFKKVDYKKLINEVKVFLAA